MQKKVPWQLLLIDYLCWYSGLNIIVLSVADLGIEIQQWPNLYWGFEPNIIHVHAEGSWFTEISRFWKVFYEWILYLIPESVGVCPCKFKCLSHDEASKYFVEPVSMFRLADNKILQLSIFKPYSVLWLNPGIHIIISHIISIPFTWNMDGVNI